MSTPSGTVDPKKEENKSSDWSGIWVIALPFIITAICAIIVYFSGYFAKDSSKDSRFSEYNAQYESDNRFPPHDYDRDGGGYYMYYPYL
jgi:hypothetical protein